MTDAAGSTDDPHPFVFARDTLLRLVQSCGLEVVEVLDLGPVSFRTQFRFLKRTEPLVLARTP